MGLQGIYQKPGNQPNFENKKTLGEKAILGATLGIPGHSQSNSRNGSHDLIYVKTLFSEQLSEQLSELVGRLNFSPNSQSVFFKTGGFHPSGGIDGNWGSGLSFRNQQVPVVGSSSSSK